MDDGTPDLMMSGGLPDLDRALRSLFARKATKGEILAQQGTTYRVRLQGPIYQGDYGPLGPLDGLAKQVGLTLRLDDTTEPGVLRIQPERGKAKALLFDPNVPHGNPQWWDLNSWYKETQDILNATSSRGSTTIRGADVPQGMYATARAQYARTKSRRS